jgi:hypothetical protein
MRPDKPEREGGLADDRRPLVEWRADQEVSSVVRAPRETVLDVYADYGSWPHLFPTIAAVRLVGREGPKLVLEVDHVEGKVSNELVVRAPDQLKLWEKKRRDARFLNCFETVPDGTRFTLRGEIHLKGWARLLQPFLQGYVRRQMRQLQLQPVKAEAEARAADAPMRNRGDDGACGP